MSGGTGEMIDAYQNVVVAGANTHVRMVRLTLAAVLIVRSLHWLIAIANVLPKCVDHIHSDARSGIYISYGYI